MKNIVVIGSTGSIGRQTVEVIKNHSDDFTCLALVANENRELLLKQGKELNVKTLGLFSCDNYADNLVVGEDCYDLAAESNADIIVIAASGIAAMPYLVKAIMAGKTIAMANKECIVSAGEIIMPMLNMYNASLIPVDSEHSAIWQCLKAGERKDLRRIILTASGGPFFGFDVNRLKTVTVEDALKHPTWSMGRKITVDSATMMNKGLEVIEAKWLFNMPIENIEVIIHRESVIHSMAEFKDGAVIAEMSYPTMEIPIQLALSYPNRLSASIKPLDFASLKTLSFYPLDEAAFPFVKLAKEAAKDGGVTPLIMNSANEVAVNRFLNREIGFTDIYDVVVKTMDEVKERPKLSLDGVRYIDNITRKIAQNI